jgi:DNA repair protein RecO (recombination protein O)
LRAFELLLLREIGLLPSLDAQTLAMVPLQADARYSLVPEAGLVASREEDGRASLPGAAWQSLQGALDDPAPFNATLRRAAEFASELKPQLRALLHYHCGVATLKTRQLMMDIQSL